MPQSGAEIQHRSQRRRHGLHRHGRHRPGLRHHARVRRGRGAGRPARGRARRRGRHRPRPVDLGAYSSRVTFMVGNAMIDAGRKLRAQIVRGRVARSSAVRSTALAYRVPARARPARTRTKHRSRSPRPSSSPRRARHARRGGQLQHADARRRLPRRDVGAVAGVLVHGARRRGRGRPRDRPLTGREDLDRARLRPRAQPGARRGPDRGLGLHGPRRGRSLEEHDVNRGGLHKGPSLLDYRIPTSLDTPELDALIVESIDPEGPYGAKEAGEGPLQPVDPGDRERGLRRGRRALRRDADEAAARSSAREKWVSVADPSRAVMDHDLPRQRRGREGCPGQDRWPSPHSDRKSPTL